MSKVAGKEETWDSDIPLRMQLEDGQHYTVLVKGLSYEAGTRGSKILVIDTPKGVINTGSWAVINFLRDNKPVIGRKFSFLVTGQLLSRRFSDLKIE